MLVVYYIGESEVFACLVVLNLVFLASQYLPLRLNLKQKRGCVDGSPIFCTSECSAGLTRFPDCAQGVEDDEFTVKGPEVLVLANQA